MASKRKKKSAVAVSPPSKLRTHSKLFAFGAVAAFLITSAAIRLRLAETPLERDEGEYAYAGQLMLEGIPPYQRAYNMKFPGVYASYAGLMSVFGETTNGIRLGLILVNAATALLLFLTARKLLDDFGAAAASVSFLVLTLSPAMLGIFAHATHFAALFAVAGLLMLLSYDESKRSVYLLLSGVMFGFGVLMKQHSVFVAATGPAWLLSRHLIRGDAAPPAERQNTQHSDPRTKPDAEGFKALCGRLLVFLCGFAIPIALCLLILLRAGVLSQFWFWTFKYASAYVSQVQLSAAPSALISKIPRLTEGAVLLWLMAAAGPVALRWHPGKKSTRAGLLGFAIFSFLACCPGFYFRQHYFIVLLPAVSLLIGVAYQAAARASEHRGLMMFSLIALAATSFIYPFYKNGAVFFELTPNEVSRRLYGANPFPEAIEIARYVKENSSPTDNIAVLGSEPEIYFLSGRRSSSGHIYMYGLMEEQPYARTMQEEFISEVESARPAYVVLATMNESWLRRPGSEQLVWQWMDSYIKTDMELIGVADITASGTNYLWGKQAAGYSGRQGRALMLYARKSGSSRAE